jgi:predicted ATPase/class 3 adenylate cyclase/DNA-binding CsgD family transcriptional regulator/tetratricopeptide (TPR) repeat protein
MGFPSGAVTLLFSDVEDDIRLWEADREAMAEASARYGRMVSEQIVAAGGLVFKTVGEEFRAVFAGPAAALTSAVAIQRAVDTESWPPSSPIRVRVALHSGACVERDSDYFGPVVNWAARLLAAGHGGQILMSAVTRELLADGLPDELAAASLGQHRLKDLGRPAQVFQVTGPGLAQEFGPIRSLDDPALRHNLPSQATGFVGRAAELAELRSLVSGGSRLVTITGPGGIGKSRLGLQVAADALDGTGDGVWLAELAPVIDPDLVAGTVAAVLGVREESGRPVLDTLVDAVADRYLLVVLDNAEHVIGATAKLADAVIRSCPRAFLLVTSREPLSVSGEHVFRVPPLAVPPTDLAAPDRLAAFESVQLFTEHAARHRQGFILDEDNAAAVAAICARLDGIPLALELAAARLGSLSATEISSRLDQRFRLLTGGSRTALPRHQTLRAMLDWSYNLLNPEEQLVLDRLSIFAGGWTLMAAETVTSRGDDEQWQALDHLAALVDKSLVQTDETHGSTRYRLLETVRHYAAERLVLWGGAELDETRAAHRDHYLDLVETADTHLRGPDEAVWLDRLEAEFDNIRAALAFSFADPAGTEAGLRLATGLRWLCYLRGHAGEVIEALDTLLGRPGTDPRIRARALTASCHVRNHFDDSPAVLLMADEAIKIARGLADNATAADALSQVCVFEFEHGDLPAARAGIEEAVELARAAGDPRLIAEVVGRRAVLEGEAGDLAAAFADVAEVLALSRATGDNFRLASNLGSLGIREIATGEMSSARTHLEEACALASNCGYQHLSAGLRLNLGFVELIESDPGHARRLFLDVLDTARITGLKPYVRCALLGLALAAGADEDPILAATLHGVADELYEQAGRSFEAMEAGLRDRDHARLHATLGGAAFEAAYQHGRTLSQADAIALASAAAEPDPGAARITSVPQAGQAAPDGLSDPLSEREREIVALLAGGATDAQIADELYLSTNTVRSHLERIRDKTGARRRTELVRYAIKVGIEPVTPSR